MRRARTRRIALAGAFIVGGGLLTAPAATAAEPQPPIAQEYLTWLDAQNDPGADETAAQFKALSDDDQQKFLGYLVDADVLNALSDAATGIAPQRVELGGGDVVIDTTGGTTAESPAGTASAQGIASGTAGDKSCWYNVKQSVLGVTITRLNFKQWYRSTRTKVNKVYNASASHTNYNIGVSISHEPEEQWISAAGNALAYVTWHGSIIYKGFGVNIDKRHHLRCDETGIRYYYLKNI